MSAPTPARQTILKNTYRRPIIDNSCKTMCPECYIQGTVVAQEDDGTIWGCPKCGLNFSLEWGW